MVNEQNPQMTLRTARAALATALEAALNAVADPNATPASLAAVMAGLAATQQGYNNAVARIPLVMMTDARLPEPDAAKQPESAERPVMIRRLAEELADQPETTPDMANPLDTLKGNASENPRLWADWFLAVNKNRAINREELVQWFDGAIGVGRYRGKQALLHNA